MRVDPTLVRSGQWWDYKIPPVIATAAIVLGAGAALDVRKLVHLVVFLVATVGVAAFGHVVNDLADIKTDALAGAPNRMAPLDRSARVAVLATTVVAGALPWLWLPHSVGVMALLGLEVALLVGYSVRPVRLKDRAAAGVVADALYAYVVPVLLSGATFTQVAQVRAPSASVVVAVSSWMLLMGLRGILWHQIADLAHDRRAGTRTLATRLGADRSGRVLGVLVVVELVSAAATLLALAADSGRWWLPVFGALYLLYRSFQLTVLWSEPLRPVTLKHAAGRVRFIGFVLLNEFIERWLPIAALVALAIRAPIGWLAVAAHLLLFENAVVEFVRRDLPMLPDALNRLAHERKARRQIRQVALARQRAASTGPAPVSDSQRSNCRWVFVVCGPEMHVMTLTTAVRHLRPLTRLEIWVVTDSTRNVRPIPTDGIDHLVDVRAPEHFDDHQASIWLKTGVHRHLPAGEWCYLDSDIIAVRPGIEAIFDQPRGMVGFVSDLPISANQVDRFSPWAMTCECSGHGETHSCSHLREQLRRRFDVEVPGEWVHWNGGVFRFGPDSADFLDMWNKRAVATFDWAEWRTRDQGALIATAWTLGEQDSPRLSEEFNFIVDLGNNDLCLDADRGWALHPSGPWHQARMLHLYTSRLEDPEWDLGRDVEAPVIRQTMVRVNRWRRFELGQAAVQAAKAATQAAGHSVRSATQAAGHSVTSASHSCKQAATKQYWSARTRLGVYWIRLKHQPQRLRPQRIRAGLARRFGGGEENCDAR